MTQEKKNVLVTGASGGIGRAIAIELGQTGWNVLLASRSIDNLRETARTIEENGGYAESFFLDQAEEDSISALAQELTSREIPVHALVNNSGIGGPSKPLWDIDTREWDETFNVNVRGLFLCCRAFVGQMIERKNGSIVNIGSITGKNPLLHRSPYAASKAALIGLTKTFAQDAGVHGVRVNLISPGGVSGERLDWVVTSRAQATGLSEEEVRAAATKDAALKRFTDASEVASAVRFFVSDESSGITGVDLTVSSGFVMN